MIDTVYKIVAFAITLGVLVVFHELGHYVIARLAGVKVLRFSVGFGRLVWSRRFGRDRHRVGIVGDPARRIREDGGRARGPRRRGATCRARSIVRSVWRRIAIVAAGPLANLLLAVLLFAGTFVAGVPGQRALLAEPPPSTPAAAADVRAGDRVVGVDGEPVGSWQELRWRVVRAQGNDRIALSLVRDNLDREPVSANCRSPAIGTGDWEGNPLSTLGLRADLGAPIVDQVLPGQARRARGARQRRPDSRRRRQADAFAERRRVADECAPGRDADVSRAAGRNDARVAGQPSSRPSRTAGASASRACGFASIRKSPSARRSSFATVSASRWCRDFARRGSFRRSRSACSDVSSPAMRR